MICALRVQPTSVNGPAPAEFWSSHWVALSSVLAFGALVPPCASTTLRSSTPKFGPHSTVSSGAEGSFMTDVDGLVIDDRDMVHQGHIL